MIEILSCSADDVWPDAPAAMGSERESSFLLPQLMGALAGESLGLDSCDQERRGLKFSLFRWAAKWSH
ncbi:hypothetical protein [Pseudomonas brassicacearum]|jgi:hypothetical protein|uniref:Uncharacterized protein n=1 Tax=Pseudomonas brassicacearum subsp. neoaurantiaca TaxID=494916 RepID=A0A7V8UEX8_9PSED|nr:hypothetical protein [Pseudomonas brassicacearum]MBA1380289.1 hypothetical protein [Pseudomonas brassicacearum subsp. neoaurantiaca]